MSNSVLEEHKTRLWWSILRIQSYVNLEQVNMHRKELCKGYATYFEALVMQFASYCLLKLQKREGSYLSSEHCRIRWRPGGYDYTVAWAMFQYDLPIGCAADCWMQRKVERRHVPQAQKTEGARRQFEQLLASLEYASDASTTAGELRHHQLQLQQQLQDTQATLLVVERSCHHCQGQAGSATLQHPEQRAAVQWPELDKMPSLTWRGEQSRTSQCRAC